MWKFLFLGFFGISLALHPHPTQNKEAHTTFTCPEDFGYFPHPSDCSHYYVCVFGGALLESCTGGLMYSHELQTCDWPRNVNQLFCNSSIVPQQPQQSKHEQIYRPIKIETNYDLSSVLKTRTNNDAEEGGRSGRSYAQSGPELVKQYNPKQELQGRKGTKKRARYKRQILANFLDKIGLLKRRPAESRSLTSNMYPAAHYGTIKYPINNAPVTINFRSRPNLHLVNSHIKLNLRVLSTVKPHASYNRPIVLKRPNFTAFKPFPSVTTTTTSTTTAKPNHTNNDDYYYYDDYEQAEQKSYMDIKQSVASKKYQDYQEYAPYLNQRYAANTSAYSPSTAATPIIEDDEESYYVYEDDKDLAEVDVEYPQKYYKTTTTTTTKRPKTTTTTPKPRTRSRNTQSQNTKSRPTLRPKSQIVKEAKPVRDVYLDPPTRTTPIYQTPIPNTPATKCKRDVCQLPDCNCGGKDIPGGLRAEETPQIVILTFDDSVNDLNKNLYRDLFEKGRKNPNGCPISATFYVSHEWTDYSQVQNLAADGHEIASHSVSHSFGESFSQKKWEKEINGQREILAAYGGVKLSEVRGMRAPFLAIGGNNMFKMLHDVNFTYDSSMPVYENRPPSWPYTLDYKIFHDCMIPPCPTKSYPGVWEVPMVMWQDLKGGRCSMGDACSNPPTAEGVYQMLAKNFERHYTTNRAPFGLYYHAAWFTQAHHKEGFEAFLDTLVQMDDVWLVTNWQALQWMQSPTSNARINSFAPWNECRSGGGVRPERCSHARVCNLWHKSGVRYMKTCQTCPETYPWTGQTGVPFTL